jgi:tripartite-type tricarboxylate transporter receptor subunit TctC
MTKERQEPTFVGARRRDGRYSRRGLIRGFGAGAVSLGFALTTLGAPSARAAWPPRIVRIVVPFGAGGVPDFVARVMADPLSKAIGTTVVVENKLGAGGTTGVISVVRAEPDGSTLLLCTSAFILNKALNDQLPYEPMKSLTPICEIANAPNVFAVSSKLGVSTLQEFVALARSRPDGLHYASPGLGTTPQVSSELLRARAGIKLVHVPYNTGPQAVQALLTGHVQFICMAVPLLQPHIEAGTLKALAVTSPERWRALPNVPTMREVGFDNFETDTLLMLAGPPGLSPNIVNLVADAAQALLRQPDIRVALEKSGLDIVAKGPRELAARIARDERMWDDIVRATGLGAK